MKIVGILNPEKAERKYWMWRWRRLEKWSSGPNFIKNKALLPAMDV
jgi:hypothetical protein